MSTDNTKKIGLITATIVGMNAMIGAGIFSVPAALALNVGPAGILTYAFVIISVWCMGTSIARLAQLFPQEGSFYIYAKQWGGHIVGLIAAGSYLIGLMIALGLLAQRAGADLHSSFPMISATTLGVVTVVALVILNMVGVVMSEIGQLILICLTIFPLITTTIICFSKANIQNLFPFMPFGFSNILAATKAVIFGFFGFECAASLFNIVEDPEKNVSKALTWSIIIVGLLYLLFVISLILAIPLHNFSLEIPLSVSLSTVFPGNRWLLLCIHISIISAVLGTIHSMIWSASSLLVSYASKFRSKTVQTLLHRNYINQKSSVLIMGCCILLSFVTFKNMDLFFSLTSIFLITAFMLSMITLLTMRSEWKSGENFKTLAGVATALVILMFAIQGVIANLIT
jgi:amino acid transporter